jgi:hypothetical protein
MIEHFIKTEIVCAEDITLTFWGWLILFVLIGIAGFIAFKYGRRESPC